MKVVTIDNVLVNCGMVARIGGSDVQFEDVVKMMDDDSVTLHCCGLTFENLTRVDGVIRADDGECTVIDFFNKLALAQPNRDVSIVVPTDFDDAKRLFETIDKKWPHLGKVTLCGTKTLKVDACGDNLRIVCSAGLNVVAATLAAMTMDVLCIMNHIVIVEDVFLSSTRGVLLQIKGTKNLIPFNITNINAYRAFHRPNGARIYTGCDVVTFLDKYSREKKEWECVRIGSVWNVVDGLQRLQHDSEFNKMVMLVEVGGKCGRVRLCEFLQKEVTTCTREEINEAIENVPKRCTELLAHQWEILTQVVPTTNPEVIKTFDIWGVYMDKRGAVVRLANREVVPFREFLDHCLSELLAMADDTTVVLKMRLATMVGVSNPCKINKGSNINKLERVDLILTEVWDKAQRFIEIPFRDVMFRDVEFVDQETFHRMNLQKLIIFKNVDRSQSVGFGSKQTKEMEVVMHVTKTGDMGMNVVYVVTTDLVTVKACTSSEVMEMIKK